ncbi:uncharacterized protein EDB93DRAFT_1107986 [Suillus bovinus]|uniref:uncharacterized protein n=1 Tax=Suillus bovinus TaxID=48563 RepID=UPI001B8836FB|nr:uncharacterized protein EDB93DRAFT_1107986 [Suillus bovinus]KAG2132156.1 hypothetical protein EDB93DRAFT_1107986 [Suillus bovinus]
MPWMRNTVVSCTFLLWLAWALTSNPWHWNIGLPHVAALTAGKQHCDREVSDGCWKNSLPLVITLSAPATALHDDRLRSQTTAISAEELAFIVPVVHFLLDYYFLDGYIKHFDGHPGDGSLYVGWVNSKTGESIDIARRFQVMLVYGLLILSGPVHICSCWYHLFLPALNALVNTGDAVLVDYPVYA